MANIPDFNDAERWVIQSLLRERHGERILIKHADVEVRLHPALPQNWTPGKVLLFKSGSARSHA